MEITKLLHKRILIKNGNRYHDNDIQEVKIIEISPTGNWTKIMNIYGRKYWKLTTEILLVEILKIIEKPPAITNGGKS